MLHINKKFDGLSLSLKLLANPVFGIIWLLLSVLSYCFFDQLVALFIHAHQNSVVHAVADFITRFGEGAPYLILFGFMFLLNRYKLKIKKEANKWFYLLAAVVVSGLLCDILKFILGRARPQQLFSEHVYGLYFFKSEYLWVSLPSGHATTAAAVAIGLALLWPRYWKYSFTAALLIGLSRIVLTVHYVSDVMVGFYLGALVALLLAKKAKRRVDFPIRF